MIPARTWPSLWPGAGSLVLGDCQRPTASKGASSRKTLGRAGAWGICWVLTAHGAAAGPGCLGLPSSPPVPAETPCPSVFLYFLGYHENGVVKAENGTSPRTKKLKSP